MANYKTSLNVLSFWDAIGLPQCATSLLVRSFDRHLDPAGKTGRALFGWKFSKWEGPTEYWLITTGQSPEPGIDGGLLRRRDPRQPCVNTIGVENLDETIKSVVSKGGSISMPKMAIPGVGWLAYCGDPEGNMFGMMQNDPAAK
jgi:predicted enzyme related to lactoylglutathione lyase